MKELIKHCRKRIREIKRDSRLKQPTASYQINAPLAFIQLDLGSRLDVYTEILKMLEKLEYKK